MATKWRAVLAACTLAAAIVLVFAWSSSIRGHLEGSVFFVGCSGTVPIQPPGTPPISGCTSTLVDGAVVVAVPGSAEARFGLDQSRHFIVVSRAAGSAISVHTDDRGKYRLDLAPGNYMVGASENGSRSALESGGTHALLPPGVSGFGEVRVAAGVTMPLDITIRFNAA